VVDVGSGQGYVSLAIAMLSGVEVIGIDNQAHNGEAALHRMEHVKRNKSSPPCHFHSITHPVGPGEDLAGVLSPYLSGGEKRVMLLGLHACGDLTSHLLRTAVGDLSQHIVAVMSLGCCYQNLTETGRAKEDDEFREGSGSAVHLERLTTKGEENDQTILAPVEAGSIESPLERGFPMGSLLKAVCVEGGIVFGRHTRTLAAQTLHLGGSSFFWTLKRQMYRSAFQQLLYREKDGMVAPHKLGVKHKAGLEMTFPSYSAEALAQSGVLEEEIRPVLEGGCERVMAACMPNRTRLYLLWTLRAVLGHCVEALILLDRLNFLEEHGLGAALHVCFDSAESPRNVGVVAWRK